MSATKTLAQFIVDTTYDKLPVSVVEAAKIAILDGVANMLAGSPKNSRLFRRRHHKDQRRQRPGVFPQGHGRVTHSHETKADRLPCGRKSEHLRSGLPPTFAPIE